MVGCEERDYYGVRSSSFLVKGNKIIKTRTGEKGWKIVCLDAWVIG